VQDCDVMVVMVAHDQYQTLDLKQLRALVRTPVLVDGRRVVNREQAEAAGWVYRGVGCRVNGKEAGQ
jgi:UDP-N-acetyl-D-mannosaminuronate dehydrogenase